MTWRSGLVSSPAGLPAGGASGQVLAKASGANYSVQWISLPGAQNDITGNAATATKLQTARNINGVAFDGTAAINVPADRLATARTIDGAAFDGTANITVVAPAVHGAAIKAAPVDADELPLVDSAAASVLKRFTWANLKAALKTYFDTLYAAGSGGPIVNVTLNAAGTILSSGVFPAYKFLRVRIYIPSMAAADTPSLQCNGDTAANYRYKWTYQAAAAVAWTAGLSAAGALFMKLGAIDSARTRNITVEFNNNPLSLEKLAAFVSGTGSNSAAANTNLENGTAAWFSAANTQITQIDLISTSNMAAGTQMLIYGQN